jgi:hypothetical protein
MKAVQILFLAIFISVMPVLVAGCCDSASCCGEDLNPLPYYKITGWQSAIVQVDTVTNGGYSNITETQVTDSIPFYKAGIQLSAQVNFYARVFSAGSSLLACSPVPNGEKGAKETITSFQIVSASDFDATHPAGSDLKDILTVRIKSYVASLPPDSAPKLDDYIAGKPNPAMFYTLLFTKGPTASKKHVFTLNYSQSDGQRFTVTTPQLTFQ